MPVDLDIFGFELPKEVRPDEILLVKGEVRDEKGELVRDATVEIEYMDTRKIEVHHVWTACDGHYATVVKPEGRKRCDDDREEEGPRLRFAQLRHGGYRARPVSPRWT